MKKCRPSKWVPWALVGAGLPWLAATFVTTEGLSNDVLSRATAAVTGSESTSWAALTFDGRDATVSGTATSQEALNAAVNAVRNTYGVRTVTSTAQIVAPVTLLAPTVKSITSDSPTPEITGTWQEGVAKTLAVTVAGTTYKLGQNPELTANGENWTLKLATPLADGDYDVAVEAGDGAKQVAAATTPGKVTIKLPPPPDTVGPKAPTLAEIKANMVWPYALTGTFDEADTKLFSAKVAGREYVLNRGSALGSDGKGNFTFSPSKKFLPGKYDVEFALTDSAGNVTTMTAANAIVVPETPPPPAPPADTQGPAAPAVTASGTNTVLGTFDPADTQSLTAVLQGRTYVLNRGAALVSNAPGSFTFTPSQKLAPGNYDVDFTVKDAAGNATTLKTEKAIVIPEPPPPAPAADTQGPAAPAITASGTHTVSGTFDEADTKAFSATIEGREYVLGRGAALTSDGKGNFTFAPSRRFAPGSYDVDFTLKDAAGNATTLKAEKAIVIPEPPPPTPPADTQGPAAPAVTASGTTTVSGTFDEVDTKAFSATVDGREYVLGRGAALTSDGKGNFTFAPSRRFAPGNYDVDFTLKDAAGNATMLKAEKAIVIPEPTPPTPKVEAAPPPQPPSLPTVERQLDLTGAPIIRGTWPKSEATGLAVALNGRTYELGKDANLRNDDAGKWSLLPGAALKDGIYDVVVTVTNAAGLSSKDDSVGELEVDGTQPTAPTVVAFSGDATPPALTGTWAEGDAKGLKVTMPSLGMTAELGVPDSPLTSDGEGTWTLAIAKPVSPGVYDVDVQSVDRHGRTQTDATAGELTIVAAGVTPKAEAPYDCAGLLNRVSAVFPMRFDYDTTDFAKKFALSVNQYAALLKDSRCGSVKVELAGYADSRGGDDYNMALSERRAQKVLELIRDAGVDVSRLSAKGYGEQNPVNTAENEDAWAENRRVELKVMP